METRLGKLAKCEQIRESAKIYAVFSTSGENNAKTRKNRYKIPAEPHVWEIDEFFGENRGRIVAEVELASEDQAFEKPAWVGKEVTGDPRYFNSNLIKCPFAKWRVGH